jgi:Tfp pilus assembly protein PilO
MKLEGKSKNAVIGAMLLVAAISAAFWIMALSPKREEAKKLGAQVEKLESSLAQHQAEADAAEEARKSFPVDYRKLVVLGKAVPGDDDTASLLVQLNRIADNAGVRFQTLKLNPGSAAEAEAPATTSATGEPISATEAAASLLPLGAAIGPAGLAVMPYTLTFTGDFFKIADFIKGLDSLVKTTNEGALVNGRLITVDGFSLAEDPESEFPALAASFTVTTYLTPPGQGLTTGASPAGSEVATGTPASTTTGGAP